MSNRSLKPWSYDMAGCMTSQGMPIVTKANGHLVAFVTDSRDEKNAALIAAAPALLHAAQLARDVLAAKGVRGDTVLMTALDNAIAQAKGR